jgi:hypothetical protein
VLRTCEVANRIRREPTVAGWIKALHVVTFYCAWIREPMWTRVIDAIATLLSHAHSLEELRISLDGPPFPFARHVEGMAGTLRSLSVDVSALSSAVNNTGIISRLPHLQQLRISTTIYEDIDWSAMDPWVLPNVWNLVWNCHDGTFIERCTLPALTHLTVQSRRAGRECGLYIGALIRRSKLQFLKLGVYESCFEAILPIAHVLEIDLTECRAELVVRFIGHLSPSAVAVTDFPESPDECWEMLSTLLLQTSATLKSVVLVTNRAVLGLTASLDHIRDKHNLDDDRCAKFCQRFEKYQTLFQERGIQLRLSDLPARHASGELPWGIGRAGINTIGFST